MDHFYLPDNWKEILSLRGDDDPDEDRKACLQLTRSILDNAPALIHIRDQRTGKILWCNGAWEQYFHITKKEIISHSDEILKKIIHPDDISLLKTSSDYYLNGITDSFGGVIRVKYPGETGWHWLVGISRVIKSDPKGIPLLTLAVFLDFSSAIYTHNQVHIALREVLNRQYKEVLNKISKREKQIIELLIKGMSNEQIAEELFISRHTVETHRKNIRMKLNVKNTSELISFIKEIGI